MTQDKKKLLENFIRRVVRKSLREESNKDMGNYLNKIVKRINSSYYVQPIHDPVQDYGVYGVRIEDSSIIVQKLKDIGAKRFRIIKNKYGSAVIAFDSKNISTNDVK